MFPLLTFTHSSHLIPLAPYGGKSLFNPPIEARGLHVRISADVVYEIIVESFDFITLTVINNNNMPDIVPATLDDDLKALLRSLSEPDANASELITPKYLHDLEAALTPSSAPDSQSLGLLCLSKIVDVADRAGGTANEKSERIKQIFDPIVANAAASLSEVAQDPGLLVPPTALLAALAPLAPGAVVALVTQPLGVDKDSKVASDIDPLGLLLEFAELPSALQPALAALLSALAGTKAGREVVRTRAIDWVTAASDADIKVAEGDTQVLCAVTLSKLGREDPVVGEKEEDRETREGNDEQAEGQLAKTLSAHIVSSAKTASSSALLPTLEGLSVLSTRPFIRDMLASEKTFLEALISLSPVPQAAGGSLPVTPRSSMVSLDDNAAAPVSAALCYGLVTIFTNLTMRKPVLSDEDQQMARLRQMAIQGKKVQEKDDPHESDESAQARTNKLMAAGVVSALRGIVRAESPRVRAALGRLCLDLVDDKAQRVPFIRDGGFKVLAIVLRDMKDTEEKLPAAQALAKLVISTPPQLLFPAPHQTNALNALSPLYLLLVHPKSTLLQKFEALMSLTNLATINPEFGARIVDAKVVPPDIDAEFRGAGRETSVSVVSRVEELLLDENTLVRRAATELVCNLASTEVGFKYFSGETTQGTEQKGDARAAARLGVLLLLADVDDMPTRQAASGALAILTESSVACKALLSGGGITTSRKRTPWERIADLFAPGGLLSSDEKLEVVSNLAPDEGLAHRGAVIVLNLATYAREENEDELKKGREILAAPLRIAVERIDDSGLLEILKEAIKTLQRE